ncbi:S46 family peptidase [Vulgatibacter sp.]|uniref:S46 family peptidase n=1 Tax=Vulgatibacter sp. TaxID=1971226 RepID=UPI0035678683
MKRFLALGLALYAAPALADEGMWTFDNFPAQQVKERYGFAPSQEWLDDVRLSSARLANGCSASFVSAQGLVMTNHHCAHSCIEQLSTAKQDYVENGFFAKSLAEEKQCPAMEVNQLVEIRDVTARIAKATKGKTGAGYSEALKAEKSKIEKACATSAELRCDVVTLYNGGQYSLYKYRRFQDVRLVWAPELDIAFFGGDPDNFMFPRYNLDATFLRVYRDGKPAQMENFFAWSDGGVKAGDLTFTSGHPGRTSRLLTISELEFERDMVLPQRLLYLAELRGVLTEFGRRGPEQKRIAKTDLFGVENAVKALRGRHEALLDPTLMESKREQERKLRAWADASPERKKQYAQAWTDMAEAQAKLRPIYEELLYIESPGRSTTWGFQSDLFGFARQLVRATEELPRPNDQRLPEYTDARIPALQAQLFSEAPVYPELEELKLTYSLTKLREALGTDHPFVKSVLGKESPESLAQKLVQGSKLGDPKLRKQLFEGGKKAVAASNDPMIELARRIDPQARALRKQYEEQIESIDIRAGETIAKARFEAYGTSTYPDATFTLRLSFGQVKGWEENGRQVEPITTFAGLYERATGADPYELPPSWLRAKPKLDLATPYNFASTNDIIGGNSGSPVINREGEIVGLIFDGNIQSLGGEYGFDESVNRAVSVHSEGILEALRTVYGAQRLLEELQPGGKAAAKQ